jgi:replicative DNA helicase
MGAADLVARLASQLSGIGMNRLRRAIRAQDDLDRFYASLDRVGQVDILTFVNPLDTSIGAITASIRAEAQKRTLGLVVVDYLQRVDEPKERNETARVSVVSRKFADLARQVNIPLLAVAQLRRFGEGRDESSEPELADLRQSGQIENDADVVLLLWGKHNEELRRWKIAKGRFGGFAAGSLRFEGACTRFSAYYGGAEAKEQGEDDIPFARKERAWRAVRP